MEKLTEHEASEAIRKTICSSSKCNDSCMYGKNRCPYEMAMSALEEVEKYRKFGTLEELEKGNVLLAEMRETLIDTQKTLTKLTKILGTAAEG